MGSPSGGADSSSSSGNSGGPGGSGGNDNDRGNGPSGNDRDSGSDNDRASRSDKDSSSDQRGMTGSERAEAAFNDAVSQAAGGPDPDDDDNDGDDADTGGLSVDKDRHANEFEGLGPSGGPVDNSPAEDEDRHANEFDGLSPSGGPVDNSLPGDESRNSHRGYGPDQRHPSGIDVKGRLDELDQQIAEQRAFEDPYESLFDTRDTLNVNTPENPTELNTIPEAASVVSSGDTPPPPSIVPDERPHEFATDTSSYPFAGDLQTFTLGANIDAPIIGDLTVGVTVEFGEEYDIGLMGEHGTFISPVAIDNDGGLAVAPDLSMGASAYFNEGFVPFESGIIDTKEVMGQYGLGAGVNFTHEEGITSLNVYGGPGAGASVTYDRAYNASARDGLRWAGDRIYDLGRSIRDFFR